MALKLFVSLYCIKTRMYTDLQQVCQRRPDVFLVLAGSGNSWQISLYSYYRNHFHWCNCPEQNLTHLSVKSAKHKPPWKQWSRGAQKMAHELWKSQVALQHWRFHLSAMLLNGRGEEQNPPSANNQWCFTPTYGNRQTPKSTPSKLNTWSTATT